MGCNSSSVVPLDSDIEESSGIKVQVNPSTPELKKSSPVKQSKSFFKRKSNPAMLESSEPPEETLTRDFNMLTAPHDGSPGPPIAFEVPVKDESDSLIRKHPPKRFRRLEEQQQELKDLTHESLDERQQEAELRRREILSQRIQSAKQRNPHNRKFVHSDAFSQESEEADWEKNM